MLILSEVAIFNVYYCQSVSYILLFICGGHILLGVLNVA